MNKSKESPDDLIETGEEAIAKYADGLESTDEAVAALDAVDRELQKLQRAKGQAATRPRKSTRVNARPKRRS